MIDVDENYFTRDYYTKDSITGRKLKKKSKPEGFEFVPTSFQLSDLEREEDSKEV